MAADVYFTTNPSEFTKLEGLYISERNPPGFIRGVDLSVVAIGGVTVRGPEGPQDITSTSRFLEVYGGRDHGSGGPIVNQVWAALLNKQFGSLVIQRIIAADAVKASFNAEAGVDGLGTEIATIRASSHGSWGGNIGWKVEDASDGDANHFNLVLRYLGVETVFENLDCSTGSTQSDLDAILGDDIARLVDVVKLADGRPANSSTVTEAAFAAARDTDNFLLLGNTAGAAFTGVNGDDGTVVSADELAVLASLANYEGPKTVLMAGVLANHAAINGAIVTAAADRSDRSFLTWSGTHGQTVVNEISDLVSDITTRSDRIIWCYNSAWTQDPETGLEVQRPPHEWMGSIFSQNDVDVHPGAQETAAQTAGIRRLTNQALSRADLIALRNAGICTLEKLPGQFLFRSGVTTSLVTGKTEITRRRMADFLQLSAAGRLRSFVRAKNIIEARAQMAGELTAFSQSLKDQGRVVEAFEILQEQVNTNAQRAQGVEKLLWRVRLIGHILHLVLETEIGTGVVIEA